MPCIELRSCWAAACLLLSVHAVGLLDLQISPWYLPLVATKEFIISFDTYQTPTQHAQRLDSMLGAFPTPVSYSIAPRPNTRYPTDFVVWRLLDASLSIVPWLLTTFPPIKSIVTNRIHNVHVLSSPTKGTLRSIPSTSPNPLLVPSRELNVTGTPIKVAIFDTGLNPTARQHFDQIEEIINWTDEPVVNDADGHGSFVAGVLASKNPSCPGLAPQLKLYSFRVFTSTKTSYTSWLLDALNYAMYLQVDVINFSFGGPDFHDAPFVDKIHECAANRITIVSAVGNSGPYYGTLTNPADQMDVIGVGGLDETLSKTAPFSSRGMSLWEISSGYGRVKPDGLAPATFVHGLTPYGECTVMNGTSMAAPLVTGMAAILLSQMTPDERVRFGHVGFLKGLLASTAVPLASTSKLEFTNQETNNIYEQGSGAFHLGHAVDQLQAQMKEPKATIFPAKLDFLDCPYMWPHCLQPLYHSMLPLTVNLTMFHPTAVTSELRGVPKWIPGENGQYLSIQTSAGAPYSGAIGVHITVSKEAAKEIVVKGTLVFDISESPPVEVPVAIRVIPTPPQHKRILWDQFRNLQYPSGYVPRDNLDQEDEPFDSQGDHIHTNFAPFWMRLRELGYHIELLTTDYSCVPDLTVYGLVLIVDPEEPWFAREMAMLHNAIESYGVSVLILSDWHSDDQTSQMHFWDANTLSTWYPIVGGSNVPAINDLIQKYHVRLSHRIWSNDELGYKSGTAIIQMPSNSYAVYANLTDGESFVNMAIAALVQIPFSASSGRLVVYGDTSCVDSSAQMGPKGKNCDTLMKELIDYAIYRQVPTNATLIKDFFATEPESKSTHTTQLFKYSKVLGHKPACQSLQDT
ncbi:hypothetical protein Ae201684P_009099 [Aphanomyces euteiches]|nr:hypothetical protein Ae201684P_009099 [Aphanomyces euteiches]